MRRAAQAPADPYAEAKSRCPEGDEGERSGAPGLLTPPLCRHRVTPELQLGKSLVTKRPRPGSAGSRPCRKVAAGVSHPNSFALNPRRPLAVAELSLRPSTIG